METLIRMAAVGDIPELRDLIVRSVEELQAADYSQSQRSAALGSVFGVDRLMIEDGTYFVAVLESRIRASGGWSKRATPFGSDASPARDDRMLDPESDAAKIRALFVDPSCARSGLGSLILAHCEEEARKAGFQKAELTATLTGQKLFRKRGYVAVENIALRLSSGEEMTVVRMVKDLTDRSRA
jgi:GNAT superfamily N-acetyltransferase